MGRKGMKGFMKSAARPASSKPEDEEQQEAAAAAGGDQQPAPAAAAAAATPSSGTGAAKPASTPAGPAAAAGGDSDDDGQGESRSKMLQRHKKEMLAHKKALQRMGKKSKDELAKLDAEITARHAKELQELDAAAAAAAAAAPGSSSAATAASAGAAVVAAGAQQAAAAADGSAAVADSASKYLKDLSVGADEEEEAGGKGGKKLSKAQKRREKMAAKDAEREARIAAELAELGPSERATEEASLAELLLPLGLGIKEIRADGHCLYRSLEDQLEQTTTAAADNGSSEQQQQQQYNYQELRELAADYIREHKDQFAPFLLPEDESADPEDYYEQYCYTLETTAAWGGHLELTALSSALQRQIKVHAVGMDTIKLGEGEFADKPVLEICYLRHAFGLGEHYNSTKKLLFSGGADAEEEEEGGDKEQQDS